MINVNHPRCTRRGCGKPAIIQTAIRRGPRAGVHRPWCRDHAPKGKPGPVTTTREAFFALAYGENP
jgi:hypothetical protein